MPLETIYENEILTNKEIMAKPLLERLEYLMTSPAACGQMAQAADEKIKSFLKDFESLKTKLGNGSPSQDQIKATLADIIKEGVQQAIEANPKETLGEALSG